MKRALISVYNKKKEVLNFVKFLYKKKYSIVSTNGTYKYLKKHGINSIEISSITSFPDILNGRIKTIHPNIYGGILADRSINKQIKSLEDYSIKLIDIVLIDFYPFTEYKKNTFFNSKSIIELIDIGGPSLIRSAAKNFFYVTPIVDNKDCKIVQKEIEYNGDTLLKTRKKLAGKAFNLTSSYDSIISKFFFKENKFPDYLTLSYKKDIDLVYGENPHQKASFYKKNDFYEQNIGSMSNLNESKLHGKKLSFNNIKDMDIAWKIVYQFSTPTCCIIKHSIPCGVAIGKNLIDAFEKTYNSDPISSFGGIIAFNKTVSEKLSKIIKKFFFEVIIAPNFEQQSIEILKVKKNLRIVNIKNPISNEIEYVQVDGGFLVQESDYLLNNKENYKIVTKKKFSKKEIKSLLFGQKIVKFVKSNAIVVVDDTQTLGISGGQPNRILAANQAIKRALENKKKGLALVSDAFFPFRDVVDEAANSKCISAILQPGGSIRDEESIKACDEHGISMAFTGKRYFKH